jgi:hypothetical protein
MNDKLNQLMSKETRRNKFRELFGIVETGQEPQAFKDLWIDAVKYGYNMRLIEEKITVLPPKEKKQKEKK